MKIEFNLRNEHGHMVGTIALEGPLDEPVVKSFFDLIVERANKYLDEN